MDNERQLRAELMDGLSVGFECWEHIPLRHAIFQKRVLTADVVAIPREPEYCGLTFAFEVKNPPALEGSEKTYDASYWASAIHQASDYVYATLEPRPEQIFLKGRRISSAFVFPTTWLSGLEMRRAEPEQHDALMRSYGAFELGVHYRVGKARWDTYQGGRARRLDLWLGGDVWRSDVGFKPHALGILKGKRRIGSQKLDILKELVGVDVLPSSKSAADHLT